MSQENVDLVRRGYEHFARTGEPDASLYAPDIEWHSAAEDPGQVVAGLIHRGRGKGSSAEVEMREWNVFLIRAGRIASVQEYSEREEALAAVGLSN